MPRNPRNLILPIVLILYAVSIYIATPVQAQSPEPGRLVLAFYYTWFDETTWTADKVADMPQEPYVSRDRAVMARHIEQAKAAGIDALVVSWYGPKAENNQTETNFATLLDVAHEQGFKVAIDFETASPFIHGQGEIVEALRHLLSVHATKDSYLRVDGRPVVFFWAIQHVPLAPGQASALDAWRAIRQQVDPEHNSLWVAEGVDIDYQEVFDGHHLYSIAWSKNVNHTLSDWANRVLKWSEAHGQDRLWVATVMPGYNDLRTGRSDAFVRDRQDGRFYDDCWEAAIATQPDWVLITSFNEWVEGTQIEPSQSYGNRYLDLTREWSDRFKSGPDAPSASPPPPTAMPEAESGLDPTPVALVSTDETFSSAVEEPTIVDLATMAGPVEGISDPEISPVLTPTVSMVAALALKPSSQEPAATEVAPTEVVTVTSPVTPVIVSGDTTEQVVVVEESASDDGPVTGEIVGSKVPLRDGPGKDFAIMSLLHTGFAVQILEGAPGEDWLQVVAPTGEVGWVAAESVDWEPTIVSVTPVPTMAPTPTVILPAQTGPGEAGLTMGTIITGTKLRKGPSSGFGPVAKVEPGDTVEILGLSLDGAWYQARNADGEEGWVVAYKVRPLEEGPQPDAVATAELTPTAPGRETPTPTVTVVEPTPPTEAIPTESPTPLPEPGPVLPEDSGRRTETLLGLVLIIAGVGAIVVAVASAAIYFASRGGK